MGGSAILPRVTYPGLGINVSAGPPAAPGELAADAVSPGAALAAFKVLAHQVGQQRRRQPAVGGRVGAVLAHDGRQGAQVPVAGPHRNAHFAPLYSCMGLTLRPATPVRASVERRIPDPQEGCPQWDVTD